MKRIFILFSLSLFFITCFANTLVNGTSADKKDSGKVVKTTVIRFKPFQQGKLIKGYRMERTFDGKCWTGSIAANRRDAWRCTIGNAIYDPCFLKPNLKHPADGKGFQTLACFAHPEDKNVTFIQSPLDYKNANRRNAVNVKPWAVEMEDGASCSPFTGTLSDVNGQLAYFNCNDHSLLIGDFIKKNGLWTIIKLSSDDYNTFKKTGTVNFEYVPARKVWL